MRGQRLLDTSGVPFVGLGLAALLIANGGGEESLGLCLRLSTATAESLEKIEVVRPEVGSPRDSGYLVLGPALHLRRGAYKSSSVGGRDSRVVWSRRLSRPTRIVNSEFRASALRSASYCR